MSGDNYQNCAKLSIRHCFITFLLLCFFRTIYSVQPCQRGDFNSKSTTLAVRLFFVCTPGVVDRRCEIGVVFIVKYKLEKWLTGQPGGFSQRVELC